MPQFDLFEQATLTRQIQKPLQLMWEDQAFLGEQIAPLDPVQTRNVRVRIYDVVGFGLGQFKGPDASMPLFKSQTSWRDVLLELALLEEAEQIQYEDYLKLHSPDETIRRATGLDMVQRGRVLALRNRRLTEWMRWQVFTTGKLVITYPTGQKIGVEYGLTSAQLPTPSTLWSDRTNADPITDVQAWSEVIASLSGHLGDRVHMTRKTLNDLILNVKIKNLINFYAAGANSIQRPRLREIEDLFATVYTPISLVIYDNGYRAEGVVGQGWPGTMTKYLPDNKVLMTAGGDSYTVDGVPIADTPDGQVLVGNDPGTDPDIRQGAQNEILYDHINKVWFLREASARIIRLNLAEAFLCATIR